jgi:hypothetical protein
MGRTSADGSPPSLPNSGAPSATVVPPWQASCRLCAARFDVTVNDGGSMGAATMKRGFGGWRPPPARRQRTWIWTPSQGKHHRQSSLSDKGGDGGTSAAYLRPRLARDHEDILARYERGEFPSVKAAARQAGIVKASFDRTKRLLGSTPVPSPHPRRPNCGRCWERLSTAEATQSLIEGQRPASP